MRVPCADLGYFVGEMFRYRFGAYTAPLGSVDIPLGDHRLNSEENHDKKL